MKIALQNLETNRVLRLAGRSARIELDDHGQASVRVGVTIGQTNHVNHPVVIGKPTVKDIEKLTPGVHDCSISIVAIDAGGGRSYDATVAIDGTIVATARGEIPEGKTNDMGLKLIQLVVS